MDKNVIKTLKPKVFLDAMQYIKLEEDDNGKIGCCYSINKVFNSNDIDYVETEITKYTNFLLYILGYFNDGGFWWVVPHVYTTCKSWNDETQTARIIALQLAAIILKEKQSKR